MSAILRSRLRLARALLGLACTLVLAAQHASLAHAVLHAYRAAPAQQQDAFSAPGPGKQQTPKVSAACALDPAFCQVLGAACGAAPVTRAEHSPVSAAPALAYDVHDPLFQAPLSRGPPAFR